MSRPRHLLLLLLAAAAFSSAVPASGVSAATRHRSPGPSRRQITTALRRAERASAVWATVNICNSHRYPDVVGIRGQMIAVGFTTELRMVFEIDYWSYTQHQFRRLPHVAQLVTLGTAAGGTYQGGVRFRFHAGTGLLRGRVRFEWWLNGHRLGSTERLTRLGHGSARYSDPRGFSDWKCVIP